MILSTQRTWRVSVIALALLIVGLVLAESSATPGTAVSSACRDLDIERRIAAQRAIEEVWWRHRVWPQENPSPKPPQSAVMPDEVIRAKVEDYLKKSNALETWWQRPVTAEQLQAELDRMSNQTRDPETLRELYAALGDDASLIAETLARPTLVERLIRNWYSADSRFHGAVRQEAEQALAGCEGVSELKALGGQYVEQRYVRRGEAEGAFAQPPAEGGVELDGEEWDEWKSDLARRFGAAPQDLPLQRVSELQEESDRFVVTAVLALDAEAAVVASAVWRKRSFEEWWAEARVGTRVEIEAEPGAYAVTAPLGSGCVGDTWEEGPYFAPVGRTGHTAVWTGTEMIVWGGGIGSHSLNSGGRYNPSTDSWTDTSTGANVPSARYGHTAVWTGTEMVVWGGYDSAYLNNGGRYNPSTDTWTATSTGGNVPAARESHTAVWSGTEMIVWGGYGGTRLNTGGRYNPVTDSWTATSTFANVPAARDLHTAVWTGTEMIVWGGAAGPGSYLNTGGRYNPVADSWTATSTGASVPAARISHTAAWTGTEMIVWGGIGSGPNSLNTGGRYNPSTQTWTATSTGANVPSARREHTAVWSGTEMIVWGGGVGATGHYTGGRYDPSSNSWTATSTGANVPAARFHHTAVWTGTELVVWGGYGGTRLNTGGRYNPVADSWTATSTGGNVPAARESHTSVWTGTEMIIWGGSDNGYLNTGGRYSPVADSWTATSTGGNVPAARESHTSVWTGTEMIIWGGSDNGYLNTGGRYNPSTDSWTATSTGANVPSARDRHTALWTGSEMVVWGGGFYLNTGGRYNPSTDSWTATSTGANVPAARREHTAVWTGTAMVVWGGDPPDNTVGFYCPCSPTDDTDGDGLGDACDPCPSDALNDSDGDGFCGDVDNCPTWSNPGQGVVLFGSVLRAVNQFDFNWPEPVDWELAIGNFTTTESLGALAAEFYDSGVGTIYSDVLRAPAPGSGRWYLWRPNCPAGSYSTGMPSEVGDRDAALIP